MSVERTFVKIAMETWSVKNALIAGDLSKDFAAAWLILAIENGFGNTRKRQYKYTNCECIRDLSDPGRTCMVENAHGW